MITKKSTVAERKAHFVKRAHEKYGSRYDYSLVEYTGSGNVVKIICKEHGIFKQRPANHLTSKEGCYQCGKNRAGKNHRLTQNEFIKRANSIHNNFYNYTNTEYVGSFLPVTINCPNHGDFNIQPNDHLFHEAGCKQCGYENRLSKGERKIALFLDLHHINFTVQHTFSDLKALDGINSLRYDFFLTENNILLEFDGPHHDRPIQYIGMTEKTAQHTHDRTVIYDRTKNEYAKRKGIRLIRIPYVELKNIDCILYDELFDLISVND